MAAPVTRGEFKKALAVLATKDDLKPLATKEELKAAIEPLATKEELKAAIEPLATKAELKAAIEPLATKEELKAAIEQLATKAELELWGGALLARVEQRLADELTKFRSEMRTEFAHHARAFQEFSASLIRSLDDKYKDLPPRVGALESAVFGGEPR